MTSRRFRVQAGTEQGYHLEILSLATVLCPILGLGLLYPAFQICPLFP